MGGRAILLLIVGFSLIFLLMGQNFGRISTEAVSNFSQYYSTDISHNIALSGANMAANEIFLDPTWTAGFSNLSFQGGTMNVTVDIVDAFKNIRRINSTGIFRGDTSLVQVTLQPSKFSKFAYYSVDENGIWWTTGDTVSGPFHTQDYMRVAGHPVFNGKTSTKMGIIRYNSQSSRGSGRRGGGGGHIVDDPIINGQFEQGVDLPMPPTGLPNLQTAAGSGGYTFTNHDTVYLTFAGDSIKYKFSYRGTETTRLASSFAPNGVIFANNATVRLKGVVKGQYTVSASDSTVYRRWGGSQSNGRGNIYIDDDIVYNSDPRTNPASTDMLGIVAKNNVYVTNNTPNRSDVKIDAAIYAETGGFGAEDYDSRPVSGTIYLLGGITQHTRQAVGTFNSSGIRTGFQKSYSYDNRLLSSFPPSFPDTGSFEIVSWYE